MENLTQAAKAAIADATSRNDRDALRALLGPAEALPLAEEANTELVGDLLQEGRYAVVVGNADDRTTT